jgi:hypothetical protein
MHGLGVRRASTAPTSLIPSRSADAAEAKNRTTDRCGYPCMGSTCLQPFAAWKVPLTCRPVLEAMWIPDRSCGFYFRCLIAETASHIIKVGHVPPISVPWRAWAVPGLSAAPKTSAWRRIRYEEVQGRCQAMLLCLRGVIGLGHGVDRLLPSRILHYCSQTTIEAVDADGAQRLQSLVIAILANTTYSPMAALVDDRQCNVPHEDPRI